VEDSRGKSRKNHGGENKREKRGRGKETRREGVEERGRKKKERIMEVKKIAEE